MIWNIGLSVRIPKRGRGGWRKIVGAVLCGALLAACEAGTNLNPDPVARTLTWFSYLNDDDIRRSCRPGAPSHLRLVYNAVNVEHVRTYDVHKLADGARMDIRVLQGFDATDWNLGNVLSPWQGQSARITLRSADLDQLLRATIAAKGVPVRTELPSWHFWWLAVGCIDGAMGFKAFLWQEPGYPDQSIVPQLMAWDPTGTPFNMPRKTDRDSVYGVGLDHQVSSRIFQLRVDQGGLFGVRPLFGQQG